MKKKNTVKKKQKDTVTVSLGRRNEDVFTSLF